MYESPEKVAFLGQNECIEAFWFYFFVGMFLEEMDVTNIISRILTI